MVAHISHFHPLFLFVSDSMEPSTLDSTMANSVLGGGIPADIKPDLMTLVPASQQPTGFSPTSTQPGFSPNNSNHSGSGYSPSSSTGQQQNYFSGMMPNSTTHMSGGAAGPPAVAGGLHSPTLHSPSSTLSPTSTMGYGQQNLPTKHICAICGDRASGKHYGVHR